MWLKIDDKNLINLDLVKAIEKEFNNMIVIRYESDQDVINFRNEWTRDAVFDDIKNSLLTTSVETGNERQ